MTPEPTPVVLILLAAASALLLFGDYTKRRATRLFPFYRQMYVLGFGLMAIAMLLAWSPR